MTSEEFAHKLSDILPDFTFVVDGGRIEIRKDGGGVVMYPRHFDLSDDGIIRIAEFLERVFEKRRAKANTI